MIKIKRLLILFCLTAALQMFGQDKQYLDYIVTENNDTIYGTFQFGIFKTEFREKDKNSPKDSIVFINHSTRKIKSYRYNDFVTVYEDKEDGIYKSFENTKKADTISKKLDYIITANDTIYGRITSPILAVNKVLITSDGKKITIKNPDVPTYFCKNFTYDYKIREKYNRYNNKGEYLARLFLGKGMNSYVTTKNGIKVYYIEKNNKVSLYHASNVRMLFGDDPELMDLIYSGVYNYDNVYLMLKFYSRTKDN